MALLAFGPRQRKKVKYIEPGSIDDLGEAASAVVKKKKAVKKKPQKAGADESTDASLRRLARALKRYGDFVSRLDECAEEAGLDGKTPEVYTHGPLYGSTVRVCRFLCRICIVVIVQLPYRMQQNPSSRAVECTI